MSQIIEINTRGYCVLYRGGYDMQNHKGLDPYDRKREPLNLNLHYSWNETVSLGMLLHHHSERTSSDKEICEFFGVELNTTYDSYVECNLKCIFTNDDRIIIYKNTNKDPIKVTKTVKNRTKEYKLWTNYNDYFSKGPFTYTYWKFDKNVKYLVFDIDWRFLFRLLPIEYSELEIEKLAEKYDYKEAMRRISELLPIDLNESWDYNSVQKKEIEQAWIEKREKERKEREELEIRKHTPGYCCVCGAENANYVVNPYYYEMYGTVSREWLCPSCEYNAAMDV